MESQIRHARGGPLGEGHTGGTHLGFKWCLVLTTAAIVGIR